MGMTGKQICYTKGAYKYDLQHDWDHPIDLEPPDGDAAVDGDWVRVTSDGTIHFKAHYLWDGPSGPAIDTQNFMRASLVHDGLYQLLREGKLSRNDKEWSRNRKKADKILRTLCKQDGMGYFRRAWVYRALRWFGGPAATGGDEDKMRCAPEGCDLGVCG